MVLFTHSLGNPFLFSGKCVAIEGINSSVQALKNKSPVAAENFIVAVEDINTRWNKLVDGIFDREVYWQALTVHRVLSIT